MPDWRKRTLTFIDWEETKEYIGTLIKKDVVNLPNGPVTRYVFQGEDGTEVSTLGGKILDEAFEKIEVGTMCRLVYLGTESTQMGQTVNLFEVYTAD